MARKTALKLCEGDDKLQETYDGSRDYQTGSLKKGEVADPCLARLWPDFAALDEEPEWRACALALYGPLVDWCAAAVEVSLHNDAAQAAGEAA